MDDQSNTEYKVSFQEGVSLKNLTGPASCVLYHKRCNCEALHTGQFMLQPLNSLSSLFILIYGMIRFVRYFKNKTLQNFFWEVLLIFIGLGSFFFHARLQYWTEIWDFSAIYWIASAGTVFFINKSIEFQTGKAPLSSNKVVLLTVTVSCLLVFTMLLFPTVRTVLAGLVLLSSIFLIARRLKTFPEAWSKRLKASFSMLLVGGLCFVLDVLDPFCFPESWFQLHVVWHLLMTFSLIYLTPLIAPLNKIPNRKL